MAERTVLMEIPAVDVLHMHIVRSQAARDVLAERERQIKAEGWTPEHDDEHGHGELAFAAACYAHQASARGWVLRALLDGAERYTHDDPPDNWPDSWDTSWWKPKNPRRDLVRAAALLLAEIERLDRAILSAAPSTGVREDAAGVPASEDGFKAAVLRCRYPVCRTIHPSGWGWDTSRLNEVIADHAGVGGLDHQTFPPHSPIDGKDR